MNTAISDVSKLKQTVAGVESNFNAVVGKVVVQNGQVTANTSNINNIMKEEEKIQKRMKAYEEEQVKDATLRVKEKEETDEKINALTVSRQELEDRMSEVEEQVDNVYDYVVDYGNMTMKAIDTNSKRIDDMGELVQAGFDHTDERAEETLNYVDEAINGVGQELGKQNKRLDSVEELMQQGFDYTDESISDLYDYVDDKTGEINDELVLHDARLESHGGRLNDHDKMIEKNKKDLAAETKKRQQDSLNLLNKMKEDKKASEEADKELGRKIEVQNARLESTDEMLTAHEGDIQANKKAIADNTKEIEASFDYTDDKIAEVYDDVTQMQER